MSLFASTPGLLEKFRQGERAALEQVYWHYVERVETIVRAGFLVVHKNARISGAERHEVIDLVQETFARAFVERARLAYDGLRPYGPFISTIARNLLINKARKSGRQVSLEELPEEPPQKDEVAYAEPVVMTAVEEYLSTLPGDLRGIHEHRYVRGLSQEEAGSALGLSRQQLRTREAKLRQGLADFLKARGLG